jgi:hypothetical protein
MFLFSKPKHLFEAKKGPIYSLEWNPVKDEFIVIYGSTQTSDFFSPSDFKIVYLSDACQVNTFQQQV